MASRRTPSFIALEILNCIDEKGEATKWDLIKILGNEAQFSKWVDNFLLDEGVLIERREGRNYFFSLTDRGRMFLEFLRNGNIIRLYSRISGKRLGNRGKV